MSKKLVIIGASGHGKVIADIAKKNGYHEIVFLDDNETIHECYVDWLDNTSTCKGNGGCRRKWGYGSCEYGL